MCLRGLYGHRAFGHFDLDAITDSLHAKCGPMHRDARAAHFDGESLWFGRRNDTRRERAVLQTHGEKFTRIDHRSRGVRIERPTRAPDVLDDDVAAPRGDVRAERERVPVDRPILNLSGGFELREDR